MSGVVAEKERVAELRPEIEAPCVVCGGTRFETICTAQEIEAQHEFLRAFHRRRLRPDAPPSALEERAEFSQNYATEVVACAGCGLVLRNPRPSAAQIARRYSRDEYGHERLESLFEAQLALYRPKAARLRQYLPPGSRVVEVGSFVGGFLAAGREQVWDVQGVDPGAEVDAFCAERHLPVVAGTLADAPIPAGVDCIAVWNTFDQLPDPNPTLAAAHRLLRPGGLLILRVPNGACFRASIRRLRRFRQPRLQAVAAILLAAMTWNNLPAFPYLYGYSVPTLDRLLARYGLFRADVQGDVLCCLSDARTKRWAAWEERCLKAGCRGLIRLESLLPNPSSTVAPWLDVTYRVP